MKPFRVFLLVLIATFTAMRGQALDFLKWEQLPPLPDKLGIAAPFAGVSGEALIVAGGANFPNGMPWDGGKKIWHDEVYVLTEPQGQWITGFKLPRPNAYGVAVTTKDGLVCIGGGNAQEHFPDVFLLKWQNGAIVVKNLPALPIPVAFASGALLGETIYVAGGIETPDATNALQTFWSLDTSQAGSKWEKLEPWPGPARMLAVAAVQDGSFFLAGGTDLTAGPDGKPQRIYLRDAYRFTPGRGWRKIAEMPRAAVAAPSPAPALGQSHFLVIGGDDGTKVGFQPLQEHPGFTAEILAYHTITDTWAKMGTAAVSRVTAPAVWWKNRVVVPSGEVRPGVRSAEVWTARPITQKSAMAKVDYIIVALYLGGMVAIGLYCSRRHQTTSDFFLGGQRIPWWAAGVSIFGTQLSAITFLAIPAKVYASNWTYFLNNLMILAIAPVIIYLYLPFYRRLNITTVYEYLEMRFNLAVRLFGATAFCIFQIGRMGIVLVLPAMALSAVTGIDTKICILAMGILTTLYSATGGIEAIIWTDLAQVTVLLLAAVVCLILIALQVDGGFGTIVSMGLAEGKFHMIEWSWDLTTTSIFVMTVGPFLSHLGPYSADQAVVQRYLTTADEKQAAKSIWTNAAMVVPATLLFFSVGTALFIFYKIHPEKLNPALNTDAVFPWFISHSLPTGVLGLVIAGVFAAAMSSLDNSMNSVSTVITTDFYRRFKPQTSDKDCLRLARWITVILGVAATAAALFMAEFQVKSLWDAFLKMIGLIGGGLAGVFFLGRFTKRANSFGAIAGALASALVVSWITQNTKIHILLYGGCGLITCIVVGYVASLVRPTPPTLDGMKQTVLSVKEPTT